MKKFITLLFLLSIIHLCYGQQETPQVDLDQKTSFLNIGLGIGLDYGGIGGRIQFVPLKHLNVYAGLGYAIVGFGYNFGAQYRILPSRRACPILGFMYGYNGVIKVKGYKEYDKIYYGSSVSGGIELHSKRNSNFFSFELVVPFRKNEFYDDWDTVKQNSNIVVQSEPLPLAVSIGYHFALE